MLCAKMLSPRRLHTASTVLILQVPFFICRYFLLNIQVPLLTRQQAIHDTVLFTPDLLTPQTAFPSLPATVPVFWNVSMQFSTPVHTHALPRPRDAPSIDENWTLTERRVHHFKRTVPCRYLLCYHTVNYCVYRGSDTKRPCACCWYMHNRQQDKNSSPQLTTAPNLHGDTSTWLTT